MRWRCPSLLGEDAFGLGGKKREPAACIKRGEEKLTLPAVKKKREEVARYLPGEREKKAFKK